MRLRRVGVRLTNRVPARVLRVISRSRLLSTLFFLLRGSLFAEQQRSLKGRAAFLSADSAAGDPIYSLMRDIHRIEKGLCHAVRRPTFAEGYIETTVLRFERAVRSGESHCSGLDPRLRYAFDVLSEYFAFVESTPPIEHARSRFEAMAPALPESLPIDEPQVLLHQGATAHHQVLEELAARRRSHRQYSDSPVSRDLVDEALRLAARAPSGCNRQAYQYRIIDSPPLLAQLIPLLGGAQDFKEQIRCLAFLVGRYRGYADERDRHLLYVDAGHSAMLLELALEALGLGSCPLKWPDSAQKDELVSRLLHLEEDECVVVCLALGIPSPDERLLRSERKSLEMLRRYNTE